MNALHKAKGHPCFDESAHHRVGRMHIPVAPACNIKCRYCYREVGSSDNRPGVAYKIMKSHEVVQAVESAIVDNEAIKVIGVAGPGDALANKATFISLSLIQERYPELKKCISTNGLLLPQKVDELLQVGVSTISVTLSAIDPAIGREFYQRARFKGRTYYQDAFDVISEQQLKGIELAAKKGMVVKINTVLVPELNQGHIEDIAREVKRLGAALMNIMPLKPIAGMSGFRAPTCLDLEEARYFAEKHLEQFRACKQCRADAIGIPGLAGNIDLNSHGNAGLGHGGHGQNGGGAKEGCGEPLSEMFAVPLYH